MPQRSFRLTTENMADLGRIAEHLATLDRRAANQTTALAWAISRGVDAVEAAERQAGKAERGLHGELLSELRRLSGLCEHWTAVVEKDRRARQEQDKELGTYRLRVPALEEKLRRSDSAGRWVEIDEHGHAWTCENGGRAGVVTRTPEPRTITIATNPR